MTKTERAIHPASEGVDENGFIWRQKPGTFPWMFQQKKEPIEGRPLSIRENYRRAMVGENPLWMPAYIYETCIVWPDVIEEHPVPEVDGVDWWGTEWIMQEEIGGMMVKPGTRIITDISKWEEEVAFPDIEAVDWETDGKKIASRLDPDRPHIYQCVEGLFERLHELMPFDETILAMSDEDEVEYAKSFFERMADYKIETCKKVFENYGRIDGVLYHDDWGTQRAGFFSNEMFREIIMPPTKRILDFIKSRGMYIELHSCGLNIQYVPEMIEMGIDCWNPQLLINDPKHLKETYGDRMTFVAPILGLDGPEEMDEEEIRGIVRGFIDEFAPGKRTIAWALCPFDKPEREAIALDELYKYSFEKYKEL